MEELLCGVLQLAAAPGEETAKARANVNLNVNIQVGISIIGSKNVVVFNGKRDVSKDSTRADEPLAGRKRRAESVSLLSCSRMFFKEDTDIKNRSLQICRRRWIREPRSMHRVGNGTR